MAKTDNRKQIKLSMSPEEYKLIEAKAQQVKLPLATFIRNYLLDNINNKKAADLAELPTSSTSKKDPQPGMVYLSDLISEKQPRNSEVGCDCDCDCLDSIQPKKTDLNGVNLTINIQR